MLECYESITQVAEKGGNLVFTLIEQDLDCATMEMISQRYEMGFHNGFVVECIQATLILRIERGARTRVRIVRNNGRFALFSDTKLQVLIILPLFTS